MRRNVRDVDDRVGILTCGRAVTLISVWACYKHPYVMPPLTKLLTKVLTKLLTKLLTPLM